MEESESTKPIALLPKAIAAAFARDQQRNLGKEVFLLQNLSSHLIIADVSFYPVTSPPDPLFTVTAPYSPPSGFERQFRKELPDLYKYLKEAIGKVSWSDVTHWMWPLFTEEWGSWRYEEGTQPKIQ
ncbi:unnamed protein product [Microthlaspi erraticum]|uniref:Uncharacterized protein n=1 Tax=Microthlaspi erraticum TaxID=1685480 RepID=A0A6D2J082_9BRAS|nr:unnamed protein product [Microthlaspi erraticum]